MSTDNPKSLEEQIDAIGQEIMATSMVIIAKLKNREKIEPALIERQEDMQKQFKVIQSVYRELLKMNRVKQGAPNEQFNAQFLAAIKKTESTVGAIVKEIPKDNNGQLQG